MAALEAEARTHGERHAKLEAECGQAVRVQERLTGQLREAEQRERKLQSELQRCHSERERARERLGDMPQVLRAMQSRLTDSLLKPLEELISVELGPPGAASSSSG